MPRQRRHLGSVLHSGSLEHLSSQDSKWRSYWCTLRANTIYIFASQTNDHAKHKHTLSIDEDSRIVCGEGNEKNGYTFELYSGSRVNKFKTKKQIDRQLWEAYVEGVAKGFLQGDKGLPKKIIEDICVSLQCHIIEEQDQYLYPIQNSLPPIPTQIYGLASAESSDSGSFFSAGSLEMRNPLTLHHLGQSFVFYKDPSQREFPSWFFKDCTRDLAENILNNGIDLNMGNTLMRLNNNIVISKAVTDSEGCIECSHWEVQSDEWGYRIRLDKPHPPVATLEELMEFFITEAGTSTKLMVSNDLELFGLGHLGIHERSMPRNYSNEELVQQSFPVPSEISTSPAARASLEEPIPPPLPGNHPRSLPKSRDKLGRSMSVALDSPKQGPPVLPKPKKSASFDNGVQKGLPAFLAPSSSRQDLPENPPPLPTGHPPPLPKPRPTDYINQSQLSQQSGVLKHDPPVSSTNEQSFDSGGSVQKFKKHLENIIGGQMPMRNSATLSLPRPSQTQSPK